MTLYEFNTSDELEQLEAIWKYGVVVAEREDEVHRYKLYQVLLFMWNRFGTKNTMCEEPLTALQVPMRRG